MLTFAEVAERLGVDVNTIILLVRGADARCANRTSVAAAAVQPRIQSRRGAASVTAGDTRGAPSSGIDASRLSHRPLTLRHCDVFVRSNFRAGFLPTRPQTHAQFLFTRQGHRLSQNAIRAELNRAAGTAGLIRDLWSQADFWSWLPPSVFGSAPLTAAAGAGITAPASRH
jgi:hypothetical protein